MLLPWVLCGVLLALTLALGVKVRLLQTAMDELGDGLEECLGQDTNCLLTLSSRDRHARRLAARLNSQLRLLRSQRQRYQNGDRELKEAVTNISHDLRTPLTAMFGYLDLLAQEPLSPAARRYLALVQDRAQALRQLTEELFRYSVARADTAALPLEPVCLNAALEESAASFYAALTQRGITPVIRLCSQPVSRRLNREALARILGNILSNALKYSDGDLTVTLAENGEMVFANTAAGLDEVQVARLFDRFFSVESARNATGLGLSIAKTLTERMGGQITAQYSGQTLSVRLFFP